jgi:tetratricopeptide (TPR) repeat protein
MSEFHVQLAGVELGPYTEEQVRQHLAEGLLSPMDKARLGNEGEWFPLSHVLLSAAGGPASDEPTATAEEGNPPSEAAATTPDQPPKKLAPATPDGVTHLPVRPQPEELAPTEPVSALSRKTVLIEPKAPKGPSLGNRRNSSNVTAPLVPAGQATKKVSRGSLLNALAQKTAPMGERPAETPAEAPPPAASGSVAATAPMATPEAKRAPAALARALSAKTTPMRSSPAAGIPPLTPVSPTPTRSVAVTEPMPSKPGLRPSSGQVAPPASNEISTKKLERGKPAPAPEPAAVSDAPTAPLFPVDRRMVEPDQAPPAKTPAAGRNGDTAEPEPAKPIRRRSSLPSLILFTAALAVAAAYYVWSPYHAAAQLRSALANGNPADLDSAIDFPLVRDGLKQQIAAQVAPKDGTSNSPALAMLDNSIDSYVTPAGIAGLIRGSEPKDERTAAVVTSATASQMLTTLNTAPVRMQGLVSLDDFVIDFGVAVFHLKFHGVGWDLKRVDLGPDLLAQTPPAALAPVVSTYLERGNDNLKANAFDPAISDFSFVLSINPQSAEALTDRGSARQSKGDLDGAIKDYTQAIAIDPTMAAAYNGRGNARNTKGDLDGAVADYTKAIELNPGLATAYDSRGNVKTAKGDLDGAIADYTQAITVDPHLASAYSDRGFARQANGNMDGAISDYTQALALDPKRSMAYFNRGLARQSQGNLEAAIVDFDRALAFDPQLAIAYLSRGNAKYTSHDLDGAISDYTQGISLNATVPQAFISRGVAREAKGDTDGAIADYTQALVLDPKSSLAYDARSVLREKKGDADGAIADSSQAIDLDPKNTQAYYTRALAKITRGNLEGALADLKSFIDLAPTDRLVDKARLYSWLAAKIDNAKVDADQELIDALQNNWNSPSDDLVTKTAGYFLGHMNEADYLAATANAGDDAKQQSGQAWYFVGMKRQLAGDTAGALEAFQKCITAGESDEALLARSEVTSLSPAPALAPLTGQTPALLPGPNPSASPSLR